ncbi:hypothetical protein ES703_107226 [subsurface metagenome]
MLESVNPIPNLPLSLRAIPHPRSCVSSSLLIIISLAAEPEPFDLTAPEAGASTLLTNVAFTWERVTDATSYELVLSGNADLSDPIAEETCAGTAYTYTGALTDATPYYWQVTALEGTTVLAESDLGAFTALTPVEAVVPEVIVEAPEITVEAPPVPEIIVEVPAAEAPPTPGYIWVIIAVGAVLVIAVIVLIVRTRRVV